MKKWKLLLVLGIAVALVVVIAALLSAHTARESSRAVHSFGRVLCNT